MNIVMIIPTGIGCTIGGHAGDATPAAKLLGSVCDNLIIHPNVVNASDINEMPPNSWYVEGSILDEFLANEINLAKPRRNKILLVTNKTRCRTTYNAANAARHTIGAEIEVLELKTPLTMNGWLDADGCATGTVDGHQELVEEVSDYEFDALAIHTEIDVDKKVVTKYLAEGGVNPWGGIEAIASKLIAWELECPVAHAPLEREDTIDDADIMNWYQNDCIPQIAAEVLSTAYLHCVLKGLHTAPRPTIFKPSGALDVTDIDMLVSPYGCIGRPHLFCLDRGISVIVVRNNLTIYDQVDDRAIYVNNYLEAAAIISCERAGIDYKLVE